MVEDELPYGAIDRRQLVDALSAMEGGWSEPASPLGLVPKDWKPDLVCAGGYVCHVHLTKDLAKPWTDRILAASAGGWKIVVVAPIDALRVAKTLQILAEVSAQIRVAEYLDGKWKLRPHNSVAETIAFERLVLDRGTFAKMGSFLLDEALVAEGSDRRGTLFERFLCLLFSQISMFDVLDHSFENATEEIDLVLRNRRLADRALPMGSIVLVSAKNTKEPVGVPAHTSLQAKMSNRRGQCQLGFLCSSGSIAGTVPMHDIQLRKTELIIALLDGTDLRRILADVAAIDDLVEELVVRAIGR